MLVNFVAARHLTGLVAPLMPEGSAVVTISSAGAFGWENTMDQVAGAHRHPRLPGGQDLVRGTFPAGG